ncbi:Cobalt-zinc-cadmium resistance protein czcD [Streptococcus pyogenes MGAS2096]|nr:Cobalt-zinc-cadmium resistance protein czcD [Streptococcus pyogenes MGAS2096]
MTQDPIANLKLARKGPIVSIIVYLLLSVAKLLAGYLLNASSLIADGFNNLSDIVGNVALLIGLHLASQPAMPIINLVIGKLKTYPALSLLLLCFL